MLPFVGRCKHWTKKGDAFMDLYGFLMEVSLFEMCSVSGSGLTTHRSWGLEEVSGYGAEGVYDELGCTLWVEKWWVIKRDFARCVLIDRIRIITVMIWFVM
ncbi:hypothetical protein HanRHA438_Chr05g0237001 [Helianthus annuus]|nr:hypothetical protein HanRHA438_Chr05g0237001 [Helianthus annuus]